MNQPKFALVGSCGLIKNISWISVFSPFTGFLAPPRDVTLSPAYLLLTSSIVYLSVFAAIASPPSVYFFSYLFRKFLWLIVQPDSKLIRLFKRMRMKSAQAIKPLLPA